MTATYEKIATNTLGSAVNTVTLSSIPATYTDLVIILNVSVTSNDSLGFRFNSDTGTNYSTTTLFGNGTTAGSNRNTGLTFAVGSIINSANHTANVYQINNYSNTTTFKTMIARESVATNTAQSSVNLYRSTSAISSITCFTQSSTNFTIGSTFTIYGIKAE